MRWFILVPLIVLAGCSTGTVSNEDSSQLGSLSAQGRERAALAPVAGLEVSAVQQQILFNQLQARLSESYDLVSQAEFEQAQTRAFNELDADECTEENCVRMIQELLQAERYFALQLIRSGADTQLTLTGFDLERRQVRSEYCAACDQQTLNARLDRLVESWLPNTPLSAGEVNGADQRSVAAQRRELPQRKQDLLWQMLDEAFAQRDLAAVERLLQRATLEEADARQIAQARTELQQLKLVEALLRQDSGAAEQAQQAAQGAGIAPERLRELTIQTLLAADQAEASWVRQLETSKSDEATGVSMDSAGDVYVAGWTRGTFAGQSSVGKNDAFLVKYDGSGNQQWLRQLGTSENDQALGVSVDGAGNAYVAGRTSGTFAGQRRAGYEDAFVAKFDSAGTQQWVRQLGTSENDSAVGVSVDGAGNVYVAGFTWGTFAGQRRAGSGDAFLVKYDGSGNQQWVRQLGTSEDDSAVGVSVDGAGNVYVAGITEGTFAGQDSIGYRDAFVAKYDRSGTQQWVRQLGTSEYDSAYGVSVDGAGDVYVVGETRGTFAGQSSVGKNDAFLVKYDRSGTRQWVRQLGTSELDRAGGVSVDSAGDVYVVGATEGTFAGQHSAGDWDIFVAKYDRSGTQQWVRQLGTSRVDGAIGVSVDGAGDVYVVGGTNGTFAGQSNAGSWDAFVVKYNSSGNPQ